MRNSAATYSTLALLLLLVGFIKPLSAKEETLSHTLDSVVVWSLTPFSDAGIGSRISTIHPSILTSSQTLSLSELLAANSFLYIKSRGQGGHATSSFRGTSSNHTQVNWNGFTINPSQSGGFDFSQIPTFFCDGVALCHGNGYLKNGSGALGGSINLENRANWSQKPFSATLLGEYGSNQTYSTGLSLQATGNRWISRTRLYHGASENNFRYLNKVLFVTRPFYERRQDAAYRQCGAMQEFYYRWGQQRTLSANFWYLSRYNELPQPIIVVSSSQMKENQDAYNLRGVVRYEASEGRHRYDLSIGYTSDYMKYRKGNQFTQSVARNRAESFLVKGSYRFQQTQKLGWRADGQFRTDRAHSDGYAQSHTRNSASLLVGGEWQPISRLSFDLQLMGEAIERTFLPTFSLGGGYVLVKNHIDLKASLARNYHYPSLNDLFWSPGGNPDLNPEKGFAYDLTVDLRHRIGCCYARLTASYFLQDVTDWILWTPLYGAVWQPKNLQKVRSQGVEIGIELNAQNGNWMHRLFINGTYTNAENRRAAFDKDQSLHKQLPYIPRWKGNARYMLSWQTLSFSYNASYTGERFTSTDESYATPAYWQHDSDVSYSMKLYKEIHLTARLRVENLFNNYIESTIYYPMALRCFYGSLLFTF